MAKKLNYVYAMGKRRTSSARVRLYKQSLHGSAGKAIEENTVNGMVVGKYFEGPSAKAAWSRPFEMLGISEKYYFTAKVTGGGKKGQLDAVVHGLARAMAKMKDENRKPLKKAGLLSRDSRIRERRKMNMGGKARRRKQSPKR